MNARGQITQSTAGNGLVTIKQYDSRGYLQSINTGNGSIQNLEYSFDTKGNLAWRKDNRHAAITENFGYDLSLNRLTSITINGVSKSISYADNGNILSKSDAGTYAYAASHPNAIETLTDNKGMVSSQKQDITYNSFSMPATLAENGNTASFTYGPNHERKVLVTNLNGGTNKYYSGSYERQDAGGITRELYYIVANGEIVAIFEKNSSGTTNMYYVHTDHLGSLNVITDANGAIAQESSYDAWGNRRDPATLQNYTTTPTGLITDRGFTGHEHLDAFKLINMNGRIYDPALGRFLSPDPFIANSSSTQDYNRYSYCGNSPLMYTDPSGYYKYQQPVQFCWGDFGGSGGSIFPKMGVPGGPMNDLEYDIQMGQNIANQTGDESYLNGVRDGLVRGSYNGQGVTSYKAGIIGFCAIGDVSNPNYVTITGNIYGLYNPNDDRYPYYVIGYDHGTESLVQSGINSGDWILFNSGQAQSEGGDLLERSFGASYAKGMATIVDASVIASELSHTPPIARAAFNNLKVSAQASKLIAKGNVLLTWVGVAADGIDLYNERAVAKTGDYAKFGVDAGLAGAATFVAIASFIPGVNVATWIGVGIFALTTANTYGVFDPLYKKLN